MPQLPSLDDLIALTLEAGREILMVRDGGVTAIDKADGSPVTIADQRAEAIIEAGLAKLAPHVPMLGEESTSEGRIPDLGTLFFCVDPIDGTRDFLEASGEFTVNIGLVENGKPIIGVVLAPATGALYAGEPGRALKATADVRNAKLATPLTPIKAAGEAPPWRVVASRRSGKNSATDKFCDALGEHIRTSASSSIKFCKLAEGESDLYPRFGQVSEWDAAAGHAVLRAAGGEIMKMDGSPLPYAQAQNKFLVDGFIAYASERARDAALAAMKAIKPEKPS